jgi:two-component system, NarL family, nitrate/nitrite response regulator NarL
MSKNATARGDLRVLIVEDHVLFAESLELALTVEGYDARRIPVPTEERGTGALLASIMRLRPRIVLLDLDLGGFGNGMRLIPQLARSGTNVVVVTASSDRSRWGEAVWHGARKVLPKARPLNEILGTVRRINHNQQVMSPEEREDLLGQWHAKWSERAERQARFDKLTVRERQVLGELMRGHTVRDVAKASVVSEATVRTQVKSILAKLQVTSQLAAVGLAHDIDWTPQDG